ncbi:ribonuclease H-like domain-containing protein [Tanacetum coccineum]
MQIRSSILSREALPDVRSAYATISSEESPRVAVGSIVGSSQRNQASAFMSTVPNSQNFQRSNQNFSVGPSRPNNLNNNRQSGASVLNNNRQGANQHMNYIDKELDNVFDISHLKIKVGHPNRTEAYISKIGNFRLSNGLTLCDVMVMPKYCVTLISVHKLVKENKCEGLYYYNNKDTVLNVLKDSINIDKKDNNVCCEICQRAKQTREPFPLSDHTSKRLYSLDKYQFIFSRDVKFFENIFPFKDSEVEKNDSANVFQDVNHINFFDNEYLKISNDDERVANDLNKGKRDSSSSSVSGSNINTIDFSVDSGNDADSSDDLVATQNKEVATLEENIFSEVKYGLEKYVGYSKLNYENFCFVTQLNKTREPKTYFEASKYSHWTDAMNQQMDVLLRNGTWELVDLPEGRKAIGSKWIYKIKFRSSGEIDRYKARLVAQGFGQKERIDYEETLSPIVKMVTVRCLLNIVVSMSWPVFQLDMNNAFLYGDLEEVVFMKPPEGYFPSDNKSDKGVFLALLVYVDDFIIIGNSVSEIEKFKILIKVNASIRESMFLTYYPSMVCLLVNMQKPILMSKRVIYNEASENDPLLENIIDYQKLMGKLIYLTNTRPDISYDVHCLSQFMHSSLSSHLKIAFKILRYLKSCPGLGIHIVRTSVRNKILSKSSTEVEYRALASVTSEVIWILKILKDLQIGNLLPHSLRCDSNSTIKIDVNPVFHERTKHLEIDLL